MDSHTFPSDDDTDQTDPSVSGREDSSKDDLSKFYAGPGSQVCRYCEDLLLAVIKGDKDDDAYHDPEHFDWFWDMKESSKTCGLCWALIKWTEEHLTYSPDVLPWDRNMQLRSYELFSLGHQKPFCSGNAMRAAGIHEFQLRMGFQLDVPKFRFLIMIEGGKGSIPQRAIWSDTIPLQLGTRMPVLNEWLASCDLNHASCNQRIRETKYLPVRLVDLFESPHTGVFNPKLVLTDQLDRTSDIKYTTLSHRWGDVLPVQTCKANVHTFMESIFPLYSRTKRTIPRTFADAMKITRALGLRYIWIDSICIIQDDPSDWQKQTLHMADVYRGSFLNIAAMDGPNCNGGCGLDLGWGAMSLSCPRMNGSRARIRFPADPADVYTSQLNDRGWVFQELMLAPRVLYCGRTQFYWQCIEKVHSEDGYIDHDVALSIPGPRDDLSRKYDWGSLVRDFSQRAFTKSTDRLPALRGVIEHHLRETGYSALLGMWKETLVADLGWRTVQVDMNPAHSFPTERSSLNNVPSWSWLSFHVDKDPGGIVYFPPLNNRVILTTIEDVDMTWESEPYFSDIASTKLVVTGPLQKFELQYDQGRRRLHIEGTEDARDVDTYVIRLDETFTDGHKWGDIRDYWCLQLESGETDNEEQISTFLVLEHKEEASGLQVFRRIGCGRMRSRHVGFSKAMFERLELV